MSYCINPEAVKADPRYQILKHRYEKFHMKDIFLITALKMFRDRYDYDPDWYPKTPAQYGLFTRYLRHEFNRNRRTIDEKALDRKQLENMYEALYTAFTPAELKSRLDMLLNRFVHFLDKLVDEQKDNWYRPSRQQILRSFGDKKHNPYVNIMKKIFDDIQLHEANADWMYEYLKKQNPKTASTQQGLEKIRRIANYRSKRYQQVLDLKEALAALLAPRVGEIEGFVVDVKGNRIAFNESKDSTTEENDTVREDNGEDSDEGTKGERYTDFRVLRLMETLSAKAKKLLSKIPLANPEWRKEKDDLGNDVFVGPRQAAVVLHKVLRHSTSESMMKDLFEASSRYPWVYYLYTALKDNPSMQATIYANFKKANTYYIYMNYKDGKMIPRLANSRAYGNVIMREAGNRMCRGDVLNEKYSIYGADRMLCPSEKIKAAFAPLEEMWESPDFAAVKTANMRIGGYEKNKHTKSNLEANRQLIQFTLESHPEFVTELVNCLQGIGLDISAKEVMQIATQTITKTKGKWYRDRNDGYNNLIRLVDGVRYVRGAAYTCLTMARDYKDPACKTCQYMYNTSAEYYKTLNSAIALTKYTETEERVVNEGKSLTTNNNFNLLHHLIDALTYIPERLDGISEDTDPFTDEIVDNYRKRLIDNFAKFEGMSLGYGDKMRLTGWLKRLYDDPVQEARSMKVIDQCGFNHVEYAKMSKAQHMVASIMMYFKSSEGETNIGLVHGNRYYEVPIQADYSTAYNFISGPEFYCFVNHGVIDNERRKELEQAGDDAEAIKQINEKYDKLIRQYATDINEDGTLPEDPFKSEISFAVRVNNTVYANQIVENLADEVQIEIERIKAIKERKANKDWKLDLGVYDKQGVLFQIFPEFNTNGFMEKYMSMTSEEESRNFVLEEVGKQMEKVIAEDIRLVDESGILHHPAIQNLKEYDRDRYEKPVGDHDKFSELSIESQKLLIRCFANIFYARQQMCKLFTGGMQQFNGLLDYEKRNMLLHAPHSSFFTKAVDSKGKDCSMPTQNAVYLEDDVAISSIYKDVDDMLQQLEDEKFITPEQHQTLLGSYKKIKVTDGQGFRTFESYRKVMMGLDKWTPELERAYNTITNKAVASQDLTDEQYKKRLRKAVSTLLDAIKPVYTGFETVPAYPGQKPVRMTVLHKYSETVLLPLFLAEHCLSMKSAPMQAFAKVQQKMAERGKPIDLFITHSGVKCGAFSIINPFEKDSVTGERKMKSADEMADFIISQIDNIPGAIHTLEMENSYGEAASISHDPKDDKIAMASQAEKVGWADIQDGDTVIVQGRKIDAKTARDIYYNIKTADIIRMYEKVREFFVTPARLDKAIREQLTSKSYSSMDLQFALTHLNNGKFAMPFFSPNVEHQLQELLSSMIKKKLTKPMAAGANIVQTTGIGLDYDVHGFENKEGLSEEEQLHVRFEGTGKNKHIKYVEVFVPLTDSKLKIFADSDGKISPARLQELVDNGTIPESLLEFVAYRTPSDAAHSLIPCRIKGFTSPIDGPSIKMPKDIMVMTGHDYDGDKVRCHFKTFKLVEKGAEEVDLTDEKVAKMILNKEDVDTSFKKCVVEAYDYSKSASENTANARANAKVELLFAQLTSPAGSRRVVIPGGSGVTALYANAHFVMTALQNADSKKSVRNALVRLGMSSAMADALVEDRAKLYNYLTTTGAKNISSIVNAINGTRTPFSYGHSADAFEYMIEYSDMIGIYAMYNSAFQMLQRVALSYLPSFTSKGKPMNVSMFNHTFDKLFELKDTNGNLASLALARLINAAVDNGKDPLLGYLHQSPNTAELTFFLLAAGLSEEQVHLIMNQPIMIELLNRLSAPGAGGFITESANLLSEFNNNTEDIEQVTNVSKYAKSLNIVSKMSKDDFASMLGVKLNDIKTGQDIDAMVAQCALLNTLTHLYGPASDLAKLVRYTRPESAKGAFESDIASIIAKKTGLDDFRSSLSTKLNRTGNTIKGAETIIERRNVEMGWEDEHFMEVIGDELSEVVALNSFLLDNSLDMFQNYFPQARRTWLDMIQKMVKLYRYKSVNKDLVNKVVNDMLLWKLLSNKKFVQGNPQEVQKDLIVNFPKRFVDFLKRVNNAHNNPGTDHAAEILFGNIFLNKFRCSSPEEKITPRLMFFMDGAPAEGTRDALSVAWGQLLKSSDNSIRNIAVDLFKYNIYTHGFGYGMYEFAHFAPCSVMWATPGYIESMQDMLRTSWTDEQENENFLNYFYLNHWGDEKLVQSVTAQAIGFRETQKDLDELYVSSQNDYATALLEKKYIAINFAVKANNSFTSKKTKVFTELYRVDGVNTDGYIVLTKAPKLGFKSRRGQVTVEYNPAIDYKVVEPVIPGNDSAWGNLSPLAKGKFVVDSSSNITAAGQSLASLEERKINGVLDFFGLGTPSIKEQRDAENKAAGVNKGDSELEKKIKLSNFFNVDTQAQPQTATAQLITHLKQQGINVKDKAAMEKFLKTHNIKYLQQMVETNQSADKNGKLFEGKNEYETDRSTKENKHFPEILGQSGKGKEAGRTLAEAANDTRRSQPDNGRQKGFPKEKFLAYLEVRARQNGTWIDNVRSIGSLLRRKGGAENEVYLSKDGRSYIKLNKFALLDDKHNIEEFIDRINSHNEFASNAPYEVLGFAENSDGNVCVVLKQPVIRGIEASQETINSYLEEIGFEKKTISDGEQGWSNGVYEIWDADSANVLEDEEGNLYFIDAVINNIERVQRSREIDDIQLFSTPQGEVYGFVDKEGNIYLDETKISPEHPIHEYTHLWDRAVQKRNPELWNRGVALMKQSSLWDEILNSKNYGKNWQSLGITGERLENLIASEIHSRLTGKQGASIIQKLEAEGGASNIVDRIKQWLLAFWKEVKATFSGWTNDELDSLTLDDFNNMTVRDFINKTPLSEQKPSNVTDFFGFGTSINSDALSKAVVRTSESDNEAEPSVKQQPSEQSTDNQKPSVPDFFKLFGHLKLVQKDENGEYDVATVPATPNNVREARRQQTFVKLNAKLREILNKHGIGIGVLSNIEARIGLSGVTVFDRATVTAEGLLEMIRIANGYEGEQALPEEFAHMALEMLGHDHPLVKRLLAELSRSEEAMQEAFDGMYDEYLKRYGDKKDKLILEAAGKLVAKHLFQYQESKANGVRNLIRRICDAIKSMFRKFRFDEVQNAIFEANDIASKIAREMLGGKLADDMSLDNISTTGEYYNILNNSKKQQKDLSDKHDVLSELHKTELKRLSILKKRAGHYDENNKPKSIIAAEQQINKLEKAIKNNKTEEAIATYITDSLNFLSEVEKSLDDVVNNGKPMNNVCAKLNVTRDTLYSFAAALDYIQNALSGKEIQDTIGLSASMEKLSNVLNAFHVKYTKLARTYFEEMLSSVYGEHGITKEIGKDKGRHISIHEMATKADKDISLMGRWFNAIKDCNDYVLKAIDDIVRDAKVRARLRTNKIRPRIEVAVADLIRATGSRDQSFMFETIRDKDGKLHRTGKYISAEAAKNLSVAQKKFYNTMIAIKKDADSCLPASLVSEDGLSMVMVRKYTWDKFVAAEGASEKALVAWEGLVNRVLDTSDSFDPDYKEVAKDFEGNKVDMLPIKFVKKGKSESFDDMTEDVAGSMMAYAGMAYQYNELNGIVNTIENAKYMASERDVIQKAGERTERETIQTEDYIFRQPFTKKAARLHAQAALDDFISMHLYGHTAANEGTFGKTRISKRKVVDFLNSITSLSQMALNLPQRISNVTTGATQVFIESVGKGIYNAKDVTWASGIYMRESADRLAQTGRTDYDNKLSLWDEYFDIHQDNGRHNDNYKKGWLSRVFNSNLLYAGLTIGEDYLSSITSLAVARNFKVKDANGKVTNLWEAYEVKYKDPVNKTGAYLALKDGYTKMDGTAITAEDELKFSKQVWSLNFDMQGIYNLDDRSAVQQYAFGALIIMYRKWIAPAIKRRYGASQRNILTGQDEEGYYTTLWNLVTKSFSDMKSTVTEEEGAKALLNIIEDVKAMHAAWAINNKKLTPYEQSNLKKAFAELSTVAGLFIATALLLRLPPDEHEGNEFLCWLDQLMLSQLLRLRSELGAQAPTPMFVAEGMRILKSPFAAIGPLKSTMNMFQLLLPSNYMTTIKSGRYKGHVKTYKYLREFPILTMYKKVENFIDPSSTIQYYATDTGNWDATN